MVLLESRWWLRLHWQAENGTDSQDWPQHLLDLTLVMQTLPQQMQDKHRTMSNQIMGRIVGMSSLIDDLEENSENLVTQAGVEETEDEDKIPGTPKSWKLLIYTEILNTIFTIQEKTERLFEATAMGKQVFYDKVCILLSYTV